MIVATTSANSAKRRTGDRKNENNITHISQPHEEILLIFSYGGPSKAKIRRWTGCNRKMSDCIPEAEWICSRSMPSEH